MYGCKSLGVFLLIRLSRSELQFSSMRDMYIKLNHAFLLVYSLTDKQTVGELQNIRNQIVRLKGHENVPMVIVGNKSDLADVRQVETSEGRGMADKWGCRFYESSAKSGHNVNQVFMEIVGLIDEQTEKSKGNCCVCKSCVCCKCCRKYFTDCTIL